MLPLAVWDPGLCHRSPLACRRAGKHTAELRHPLAAAPDPTDLDAAHGRTSEPPETRGNSLGARSPLPTRGAGSRTNRHYSQPLRLG